MQIVSLSGERIGALNEFLLHQQTVDSNNFFSPHGCDFDSLNKIVENVRDDVYLLGMYRRKVLVYGMLRGLDEGFPIPSLGIAVSPEMQGFGLGRAMMMWLHVSAQVRGANKVRLRVASGNKIALRLYESLQYEFSEDLDASGYLIGYKDLKAHS